MVLGEIWMVPFANDFEYFRPKEAGEPVGMTVIQDMVPSSPVYMTARTNAPHPNAARLWVLFNTGIDAHRLWEKEAKRINFSYPQQSRAAEIKKLIEESSAKIVSWLESEETAKAMDWFITSREGREYQKTLRVALHEGQ